MSLESILITLALILPPIVLWMLDDVWDDVALLLCHSLALL